MDWPKLGISTDRERSEVRPHSDGMAFARAEGVSPVIGRDEEVRRRLHASVSRWSLAHVSERELIARAQSGDSPCAVELLRRFRPMLELVCRGVAGDLGEDALQNLAERFSSKLARFDPAKGAFGGWLRVVATNEARMVLRKERRHLLAVSSEEATTSDAADQVEVKLVLGEIMDSLDLISQQIVIDYFVLGRTTSEIADALMVAEATVRTRIHRIRFRARAVGRRHGMVV